MARQNTHDDVIKWKPFPETFSALLALLQDVFFYIIRGCITDSEASDRIFVPVPVFSSTMKMGKNSCYLTTPKNHYMYKTRTMCKTLHITIFTVTSYGRRGVWNHQPFDCLSSSVIRLTSGETSKVCITGLLWWKSQIACGFRSQWALEIEAECRIYASTSNGSWCMGIKGEMSGTVCVTFTWYMHIYELFIASVCFVFCSLL